MSGAREHCASGSDGVPRYDKVSCGSVQLDQTQRDLQGRRKPFATKVRREDRFLPPMNMRLNLLDGRDGNKKRKALQTSAATPKKRGTCSRTSPCTPVLPKLDIPDMRHNRHGIQGRWHMGDGNSPRISLTPRTPTTPLAPFTPTGLRSAPLMPQARHRATAGQGCHTIAKKRKRGGPSGSQRGVADQLKFMRRAKKRSKSH